MRRHALVGIVTGVLLASAATTIGVPSAVALAPSATVLHGWTTAPTAVRQGSALTVRVKVTTAGAATRRVLTVQRRRAGTATWWTASRQTSTTNITLVRLPTATVGRWQFRVYVPATSRARAVITPARTVLVVAPALDARSAELLRLVNAARAHPRTCGTVFYPAARPLAYSRVLSVAARGHAADMAAHNYFSHTSRTGADPGARGRTAGYRGNVGENIAAGYATPAAVMAGWLSSAGHCSNIMSANYQDLGLGFGYSATSSYRTYWVQDFGIRS